MKKIIWIAGILLLFMILKSESCNERDESADQQDINDRWRNEIKIQFETAELNALSLTEYEMAAKRKLKDFYDYLQILSDTFYRKQYREKAGEMILQMFVSDTVAVSIVPYDQGPDSETSISQLVQKGLNNEISPSFFVCDTVQSLRNFDRTDVDVYSAAFSFIERRSPGTEDSVPGTLKRRIAEVFIVKGNKIFPPDTISLWQVYLGGVR
jgi:hypothetical protein